MHKYHSLMVCTGLAAIVILGVAKADNTMFNPTRWSSLNSEDVVTIKNSNGAMLTILITVDGDDVRPSATGIDVDNCGNTIHINAGSSAFCVTSDAANFVSFYSDSATNEASGSYEIKEQ